MLKTPHQMEDAKYLMTQSTQPQAPWSLRTEEVNPCDTTLLHVTPASLTWLLKTLCRNPSGSSGPFRA